MPRIARVVVPGFPHHVTQRGNRRQPTFFNDDDYHAYLDLMAEWCQRCGVAVWAYCLMANHAHLIAVPESEDALRRGIGEAHRRYTRRINFREDWRGHLWQGRFASFVLDDYYLLAATRYVELNPVSAGLVTHAEQYPWSSARAHLAGRDDRLAQVGPLLEIVPAWAAFLGEPTTDTIWARLQRHERTGRPLGNGAFVARLEKLLNRTLRPARRGPKPARRR
jgi:putative transposase